MTGEITLRGKVLPIGGLKSKAIAAHRAGVSTVLIPKDNAKEIPELPDRIREDLELIPVSHLDEVLGAALLSLAGPPIRLAEDGENRQEVIIPPVEIGGVDGVIQVAGD
jgi:ATP-dependent Lon protease